MNYGQPHSGITSDTDGLLALVKREATKSGVGHRHNEGPAELAKRVLAQRGVPFLHTTPLAGLVTLLTAGA